MSLRFILGAGIMFAGQIPLALHAQVDSVAMRFAATITKEDLMEHLRIIASDSFLGRDTGKEGQKMAANYLKEQFIEAGIPPVDAPDPNSIVDGYFQPFDVIERRSGTISILQEGDTFRYGKELFYFQEQLTESRSIDQLTYLPANAKVEPGALTGRTILLDAHQFGEGPAALGAIRTRMEQLRTAGAGTVLVGMEGLPELMKHMHLSGSHMRLAEQEPRAPGAQGAQMIMVDAPVMDQLLGRTSFDKLGRKKKSRTVPVGFDLQVETTEQRLTAENVLAFIEGTDRKDEVLVLTAHYDHIGVQGGVVYNGADDDGTGTVAMIGIAQAFARAKAAGHGPRRSVLVMPVSGEEKGLLGSRYYSDHPVFPLANTVADINIDMIGRRDSAHATAEPYVYVIGSDRLSTDLHEVNERANTTYTQLVLDYTFNAHDDPNRFYYRSDHYNFARKGVPSVFFFSGVHEDYHQPGDDVEKIEPELLHQRTLLAFHTAWILANQEKRIEVDKPLKP
ncbi:MAG: M28 family peptidase [Flavobacteriales bacterium]|nr:M28 family peptidase [Flavobacteriales bacterium]